MIKPRPEDTGRLPLAKIRVDGGTQMRAELNEAVVAEYAQMIRDGGDFPAIVVFFDGSKHWLGDGFHRFHAYRAAGAIEIPADVQTGTRRDAILYSVGANASHGLRRTNADKRKAVETLLADKEWSAWSDREIARRAGVSQPFVSGMRPNPPLVSDNRYQIDAARTVERGGTTYQQNTANIGRAERNAAAVPAESEGAAEQATDARARERAEREAEQAEFDRQRDAHHAALPEGIREMEAAREAAIARRADARNEPATSIDDGERIAELEADLLALEERIGTLMAENAKFEDMRVQWEKGGFEAVIAGKDEQIRVLRSQVETESADKTSWAKSSKYWKDEAKRLGWKPDVANIDTRTGAISRG